jgi:hypothetical protein
MSLILTRRSALALATIGAAAACAQATGTKTAASPAPTVGADALVTAVGQFTGKSDHVTTGGVRVVRSNNQWIIELGDDFEHDGAPDPKVALGADGYRQEAILGPLRSLTGRQAYALKAGLNIGDYNEVWIWCEKFNVPLGLAPLTLT